ncbi:MAG: hypothetical protein P8N76_01560 [Pirellulaceae bacterium]|nr:hypothetical protein [Pirellulaceae bacterium]
MHFTQIHARNRVINGRHLLLKNRIAIGRERSWDGVGQLARFQEVINSNTIVTFEKVNLFARGKCVNRQRPTRQQEKNRYNEGR